MKRLYVICEGQSEEMFANRVLCGHFLTKGIHMIPRLIGKPGHRGGNVKYQRMLGDIKLILKNEASAFATCLIDFYGIKEFPNIDSIRQEVSTQNKFSEFIACFTSQLSNDLPEDVARRFIPYIQMHEYEALLFANPEKLASALGNKYLQSHFEQIVNGFPSIEDINDSPETAPSKRIEAVYSGYKKTLHGVTAAEDIGLDNIRVKCPLFNAWIAQLEKI